jgi:Putative zinc-finger
MTQPNSNPIPNALQQALTHSAQAGPHPDFDLLAAFSEGSLSLRERQQIFAHLAACADCRELLSTAAAVNENPAAASRPFLVKSPARPPVKEWLPWAAVAACVLVASGAGLVYMQKRHSADQNAIARQNSSQSNTASDGRSGSNRQLDKPASSFAMGQKTGDQADTVSRPHWRINDAGQPERSVADGPWQAVLPNESAKMHVVSVFDRSIWIGGDNTRLYHSSDDGITWKVITLAEKGSGEHAIAHIRFQSEQDGTIESSDGTSWSTTDAGVTWK